MAHTKLSLAIEYSLGLKRLGGRLQELISQITSLDGI